MKSSSSVLLLALALVGCSREPPSATPAPAAAAPAAATYPLRGVILEIHADPSVLVVRHENIPGFMPAMTMSFKVDAATLKAAAKDQTITATLSRQGDDFWLRDVKPAAAKK